MSLNLGAGALASVAGALLMVGLGLAVLRVRPRRRENVAFAAFAMAFGGGFVPVNLFTPDDPVMAHAAMLAALLFTAAAVALAFLGRLFPVPLAVGEWKLAVPAAAVGAAAAVRVPLVALPSLDPALHGLPFVLGIVALGISHGAGLAFLLFLGLRFPRYASDPRIASQFALASAGIGILPAFALGSSLRQITTVETAPTDPMLAAAGFGILLLLAGMWLWNAAVAARPAAARNVAWFLLVVALLGLVSASFNLVGAAGVARMATVALLAYAILRHQLLGIDVTLRWGLGKTTAAAIFITVFFLVSEAAQVLFREEGNEYFGILAAGLLVFAIAPLMQFADRVAQAAVPIGAADPRPSREEAYRRAVRLALRGGITREEELSLAMLARELGIDAHRALTLRHEVEEARSGATHEKAVA
ncbi:MAG TPA: hypothetical protein VM681_10830 [Candidatus Thermoplasmatota archaeon]|nr:hypothetical protein [Candidatus Thermoplasmatota archaeon]